MEKKVLAFDFGASGGRAMCGTFDGDKISIEELHRFSNDPVILNGSMYWDAGDGWAFKKGDYSQQVFKAEKQGDKVIVKLTSEKGKFKTENKNMAIVKVITDQGVCQASGSLVECIEVKL